MKTIVILNVQCDLIQIIGFVLLFLWHAYRSENSRWRRTN